MKPFFKKYNPYRSIVFKHLLFWICVFLYFMLSSNVSDFEAGYLQLFHSTCKIIIPQIITAYTCLYLLVPKFLNEKRNYLFIFWLIILLILMFVFYVTLHMYLYEPKYIEYYNDIAKKYAEDSFWERLTYLFF